MKHTLFFYSVIFFLPATVFPQSDTILQSSIRLQKKHHEFNLGFTNLFNQGNWFNDYLSFVILYEGDLPDYYYYFPYFLNPYYTTQYGIGYKYHFGNNALRAYTQAGVQNAENSGSGMSNSTKTISEYTNKSTSFESRIGFEHSIGEKKVRFFFGIDAILQWSKGKYESDRQTTNYWGGSSYTYINNDKSDYTYSAYGAGPVLGINVFLSDMVSLSSETRIETTFYKMKSSSSSLSTSGSSTSISDDDDTATGMMMRFSPLGVIAINVHF